MKHAYLIIAHNEFTVLKALLEMLDDCRNDVFLHIDRRAQSLYEMMRTYRTRHAHLHIVSDRIPVYWGDISQVKVEYLLMETAMAHGEYDYYHLLSGVDLPIQSQDTIHRFFDEHRGKEFVSFWHSPQHRKDLDRKVSRYYFFTRHRRPGEKWHALTTPLFNVLLLLQKAVGLQREKETDFQKGPQWFSITHAFARYLIGQKDFVLKRMKHTLCPDEIFVQTVLWNSPFKNQIYRRNEEDAGNLRLIDWNRGHPYVWRNEDYQELSDSDKMFARKFSSKFPQVIERLKKNINLSVLTR